MTDPSVGAVSRRLLELPADRCRQLLATSYVGRLAFVMAGRPQIIPVNYVLHHGAVVVRLRPGASTDALLGEAVAFEVDGVDLDYHQGWSVVAHGIAEEVWEPAALDELRSLPLRPWAPGPHEHYIRIEPAVLTGRQIV